MTDELETDELLLELPLDQISDDDLELLQMFIASRDESRFLEVLKHLAIPELTRRMAVIPYPPERYFRLSLTRWTGAEVADALRILNALTTSDGYSETAGRIFDQLFEHFIAQACVRIEQPELFA